MKINKAKLRNLVKEKIGEIFSEGDVSREKRYRDMYGGDSPHETMGDLKFSGALDQSAMPEQGPAGLVKQAKAILDSLQKNSSATVSGAKDIALNRVLIRRDIRDLSELLDQLEAELGGGQSELEARGHDDFSSQKEKFMAP